MLGDEYKPDSERDNKIDPDFLTEEFQMIPLILNHYGKIKAEAQYEFEMAKSQADFLENQKYVELKLDKELKFTEQQAKSAAKVEPAVQEAIKAMHDRKRELGVIISYTESLKAKKDMLIQLGADARKE